MAEIKGGDKLLKALAEIRARVNQSATLKVGFLEDATYPDGTPVAMVAAIQNFGAPAVGIPPRPFFSNMVKEKQDEWGPALAKLLVTNDYDVEKSLDQLGFGIEGQLRESIVQTNSPALSDVTLMLRKMKSQDQSLVVTGATVGEAARRVAAGESVAGVPSKPLVDTGHLLNSVDHKVVT